MDESAAKFPDLQLFVKDAIANPTARILEYPGKWRAVNDVQELEQKFVTFYCSSEDGYKLQPAAEPPSSNERSIGLNSLQGAWSGEWLSFGGEDMPGNQPVELTVSFAGANLVKLPILPEGSAPVGNAASCPAKEFPVEAGTPSRTISLREAPPLERSLTLLLSETDSSQPLKRLVVKEDQGKDLLVDEGIAMEETATNTYTIDAQCLHPRASIQRALKYEKLTPSEHSQLLAKFPHQVAAATHNDKVTLERTDFAEHPVLPWRVTVETDSSMASDATTFFLKDHMIVRLNDEIFFDKKWEEEIPRQFVYSEM
uniref:Uncharacterized protein n=1 Tax=Phytophthora ramorum TaxID=164328 RepID=H3GN21_PHYRM